MKSETSATKNSKETDSFSIAMFNGHLLEDRLIPYPKPDASQWEPIIDLATRFGADVDSKKIDEESKIPSELIDFMK